MKKTILIILALVLLLPAILLGYGASLPDLYGETYYAQMSDMYHKLKDAEGNRVVIVGGSSVAFGVNSAQLEQTLRDCGMDYTVCNFGLYAAVGTSAMLDLSKDLIREGDVVILAIEPSSETFSTYFGATAMLKCAESDTELLLHMSKDKQSNLVGNYLSYLQERAEIQRTGILPQGEGVYAKSSFDDNGDLVYPREGNTMIMGYDTSAPIDLAGIVYEPAFVEQVNDYIASAQQKGAAVLMSFAPMNRGAVVDASEDTVYDFFCGLQKTFHCQVISNPNHYIMDSGWFYDSNFHLNDAGTQIRTHTLALDLLNYLGYYQEIEFQKPDMPASIAQVGTDTTGSEDFLFEPLGENGLILVGVKEESLGKSQLMVPSFHQGKVVVSIDANAFAGNTALTALTIPATVESIPDGAFAGCTGLKTLTLLHTENPPTVGKGLLEGAENLTIRVPSGAYHLYRDGAGCAANVWEPYLSHIETY